MSVQSEIDRIKDNVADSYYAVESKGGTVPEVQNSNNLAAAIDSIPAGGDTAYLVNAPLGTIVIWSGTADTVPQGWSICDGTNGTLDLRDKFVLGAGTGHSVGETGGSEEVTLTVEQMPSHKHIFQVRNNATGFGTSGVASGSGGSSTTVNTQIAGSSQPHPNMPPYYTALYIQKTGVAPSDYATEERVQEIVQEAMGDIESGSSLPPGGTTGQVLIKASSADGDVEWKGAVLSDNITSAQVITEAEFTALTEKVSTVLYVIPEEEAALVYEAPVMAPAEAFDAVLSEEPPEMNEPSED